MAAIRFTRQSVAGLAIPEGRAEAYYFDADLAGFGIKLSKGGARSYFVQYRRPGRANPTRMTIGRADTLTVDEARRQARFLLAKAQTGTDPHQEKARAKAQGAVTLGSVADAYMTACEARQRPGTYYQTQLHLRRHWAPLRSLALHKVGRADVASRIAELAASSGGVSANRSRACLSAMFSWAIRQGLAETNPVVGTGKAVEEATRDRVLTDREVAALWRVCEALGTYGRILRLLVLLGQRREEVGGMRWDELDLDAGLWRLPPERVKNKRAHTVPLPASAVAILRAVPRLEGRELVFGEGEGGFSGWSKSKARLDARLLAEALEAAKQAGRDPIGVRLERWTPHDLRRTAATGMARLGVTPYVVEAILNHTGETISGVAAIYNRHRYVDEARAALDRWAAHVLALPTPPSSAFGDERSSGVTRL